jgi:hypothetical protein
MANGWYDGMAIRMEWTGGWYDAMAVGWHGGWKTAGGLVDGVLYQDSFFGGHSWSSGMQRPGQEEKLK